MPKPEYRRIPDPDSVVAEWQAERAPTGEGRMYRTADGRIFEGGPCLAPSLVTAVIKCGRDVVDYVTER